jgi:hypothetical protein
MDKVSEEKKLHRIRKGAIASVIIFLVLFVIVSIFQLSWNIYRFKFAKDGFAVFVDNQLAVGIENIYKGEEATQILQKLSSENPKPEKSNEFVLLKIKIKNVSLWKAYPRYLEFRLYTKSSDEFGDWTREINFYKPPAGEFKILDTSKIFKTGEVRDGIFCYEVEKEKILSNAKIYSNYHHTLSLNPRRYDIPLTKSPLQKIDFLLFYIILTYFFTIGSIYEMLKQRMKRSDGTVRIFIDINYPYYVFLLIIFQFWVFNLGSLKEMRFLFAGALLLFFLIFTIHYYVTKWRYLIQFNWLKKEDKSWLIEEFTRRMYGENPYKVNTGGKVEINNVKNQDTYIFTGNNVRVKYPTSESKKVKEVLLDIFSETEIDWYSFYEQLQKIQTMFILYFVMYLVFITILF